MAANNSYVGKYGETIRRLAALSASAAGQNPEGQGPQPMTGAFGAPPEMQASAAPPSDRQGFGPAFADTGSSPLMAPQSQGPFMPALGGKDPVASGGALSLPAAANKTEEGLTPKKLWDQMSDSDKKKVIAQVEKGGVDINKRYDEMVAAGQITPPKEKLNKGERLTVLAETMFRFARNIGGGQEGGAAAANAVLETQGRRGALDVAAIEEENAIKEKLRQEARGEGSAALERQQKLEDTESERTWKNTNREDEQAAARDAAEKLAKENKKGEKPVTLIDADGIVRVWNADTKKFEKSTERGKVKRLVPGKRGGKQIVEEEGDVPVKASQTGSTAATTLDPDTVANRTAEFESKLMAGEYKNEIKTRMKETGLSRDAIIEQMRQQVLHGLAGTGPGATDGDVLGWGM